MASAAVATWIGAALLAAAPNASAQVKETVVVWPTLTPAGDAAAGTPLHKPSPADHGTFERAQELDATLRDAVQDLGFTLDVSDPGPAPGHARDEDLLSRAQSGAEATSDGGRWVISPRIEPANGGAYLVRIVAVAPNGRELHVRLENVPSDSVYVRGLVMLRDLLSPQTAVAAAAERERELAASGTIQGVTKPVRSQGRAVLAVNGALFGAFTAFSVQRAGGSDDPRVLYPLLAVGTGVGIGASLLVADEWDVTTGDAWYLAAGGWWGAGAGILVAAGQNLQPENDRFAWGVGGGLMGIGLATFALTQRTMDDGDATLAHSGGALGLLMGGAVEYLYRGTTDVTPNTGMGFGAAAGLVAAGALATRVAVSPSRVLLIDLGAGGGALVGTAITSPLLFQNIQHPTPSNARISLSATIGGAIAGGALGWWLTRDAPIKQAWRLPGLPSVGVIGSSATRTGAVPAFGASWSGEW